MSSSSGYKQLAKLLSQTIIPFNITKAKKYHLLQGYEPESDKCRGHGTYSCGVCECAPGYYGRNCECNNAEQSATISNCRPDNTSVVDCYGRGSCICGKCECNTRSDLEVSGWLKCCCIYKIDTSELSNGMSCNTDDLYNLFRANC